MQDEEIVRRISSIEEKIEKLSSSMDFVLSQLTNKGKALDKKEEEDVDRIKKLKIAMAKLSRTMDTITERVAIINEYINIRKKFSDRRIMVYSEEEYRRDLKMIEEISKEIDEVIEILKRLRKKF
jgi:chromosome segregation ATPase